MPVCQHTRRRRLLRFLASERHSNAEKTRDSKIFTSCLGVRFRWNIGRKHKKQSEHTQADMKLRLRLISCQQFGRLRKASSQTMCWGDLVFMHLWWDFMYQYSAICTQFLVHLDFKGTFWNEMWRMILWLKEFRVDYTMSWVACFFLVFLFVWQNQCLFPWDFEGVGVHQAPKPEARTAPAVRYGELGEKGIRAHFLVFWFW